MNDAAEPGTWKVRPKPVAARMVWCFGLLVRAWALPLLALAWVVGVVCQAIAIGFALAWEAPEFDLAKRINAGKRNLAKRPPHPDFDDDEDDFDDFG